MNGLQGLALAALLGACSLAMAAPATLRDPRVDVPRQQFTPGEWRTLDALLRRIEARPEAAATLKWLAPLDRDTVWLSFSAPFRTRTPERLDVLSLGQTEGLRFLLVLTRPGKRKEVWLLEPAEGGNWPSYYAPTTIYAARDLNQDGRRELVIEYAGGAGGGGGGSASTHLLLLDFTAQAPRIWGSLPVNAYHYGPQGETFEQEAYVVQVEKGKAPRFQGLFLNTLSEPYADRMRSVPTGKVVPLKLNPKPPFRLTQLW